MFALPWTFPGRSPETDVERACGILGDLNEYFKETSRKYIVEKSNGVSSGNVDHGGVPSEANVPCESFSARNKNRDFSAISNSSDCVMGDDKLQTEARNDDNIIPDAQDGDEASSGIPPNTNQAPPRTNPSQSSQSDKSPSSNQSSTLNPDTSSSTNKDPNSSSLPSRHIQAPVLPITNQTPTLEDGTNFNVAVLNFMDPNYPNVRFKEEPYDSLDGLGELAVNWHRDSGLVPGTTVAVYNHTEKGNYIGLQNHTL